MLVLSNINDVSIDTIKENISNLRANREQVRQLIKLESNDSLKELYYDVSSNLSDIIIAYQKAILTKNIALLKALHN